MKLFKINSMYLIAGTFLLLSATVSIAQTTKIEKWQYKQFDFGLGVDNDHYHRMSLSNLKAFAENPEVLERDLSGMTEEISTSTAGLGLYLNRSYAPWSKEKGAYLSNQSLRVGIGLHSPKESMITYKNKALDTSIVYCNLHSEFTFELGYVWSGTWGAKKKFIWYWGLGANTSVSLSNEMLLIEGQYFEPGAHPSTQESFEENTQRFLAKPVVYNRFYVPYGVHRVVGEHWSIGFDARRGFGVQTILGGSSNLINKTGTFMIGAKYRKGGF
ncbi:MAG: hypothetical protein ACI9JN_000611 [Bacteroidia bacterium]|jgi:hypothetical protein